MLTCSAALASVLSLLLKLLEIFQAEIAIAKIFRYLARCYVLPDVHADVAAQNICHFILFKLSKSTIARICVTFLRSVTLSIIHIGLLHQLTHILNP